ncbi:MAG: DUF4340 domain-containing protein [Anaerolineae bacterium]|nr:DUF4340 domain-containing protein [Anaerolineae bacterium]
MVRRTTWILLVVCGVLAVFAWWFQRDQANKQETTATSTAFPTVARLLNLDSNQVNEITIASKTGDEVSLYKTTASASNWGVKDIPADQVDTNRLESVVTPLLSLEVSEILSQSPALETIGLDKPAYTITILTTDGQKAVIYVGNLNAIGTGYYARVGNGPILILDNVILDDAFKLISEPPLLATTTPQVTETGTSIAPETLSTPTP